MGGNNRWLVYVEPHPIRDTMVHFSWVFRFFLELFNGHASTGLDEIRLFANADTVAGASGGGTSHDIALVEPTRSEQGFFKRQLVGWSQGGLENWVGLCKGEGAACQYIDILRDIRRRWRFDGIIYWGKNGAVETFCKSEGLARVAMELGCTRPPFATTLVIDPYGVNGDALPPRLEINELEVITGSCMDGKYYDELTFCELDSDSVYEARYAYAPEIEARLWPQAAGRPIAFVPLQLHDDANLLLYSDYASPSDVVNDVVPKLQSSGYICVVKPHPATIMRPGGEEILKEIHSAVAKYGDAICLDEKAPAAINLRLMELSDLVVTVNSSTGFEAAILDRTVCLLGKAGYGVKGVFPTLDEFLSFGVERHRYLKRLRIARNFLLDSYLVRKKALSCDAFLDRINRLANVSSNKERDIAEFIHVNFQKAGRSNRACP